MMPVIRISDTTWERLKTHARPLEDSVDDVVQRALDALDAKRKPQVPSPSPAKSRAEKSTRAQGKKLPQKAFRLPLMQALLDEGGGAPTKKIRQILASRMKHQLSEIDYETVSSGDPRWWNAACWERNDLVKEGFLRDDSERGFWELTKSGIELVISKNASTQDNNNSA
jgi:hypothetical protein